METGTPGVTKVVTMVLFALSCVGLLLFLWLSFGGTIPFNPQGYRFEVSFPNAQQLATQADVRIAGVSVGKVIQKSLDPAQNRTIATIQMNNKYAPVHKDARAILREKTLLGETYVDLTEGSPNSPTVPDGGLLPRGQVQHAVQLDEIFNAFDPTTRRAFQVWQQQLSTGVRGNDQNLNNVLGNLPTFAADATDILQVLDVEHGSVVRLVQGGGTVFAALGQSQTALRNLITSGETTFRTTAANNNALADTFHVFPTFLDQSKATLAKLQTFSLNTDPLIKQLIPVAQDLGPTLHSLQVLSPDLKRLFVNLDPLITVSKTGLPALREVLTGLDHIGCGQNCLLPALGTFLEQLNPILTWLSLHQQLVSDFISNGATPLAGTTTSFGGPGLTCSGIPCGHYLRQFGPTGAETFGIFPNRDANNRGNTYPPSLWLQGPDTFVKGNYPSWDCNNAGGPRPPSQTEMACWVAPPLPGAQPGKIPQILQAKYPSR
jgi:phospholipid/cholesterol/gamma-HCH transport system substrate-binding protein